MPMGKCSSQAESDRICIKEEKVCTKHSAFCICADFQMGQQNFFTAFFIGQEHRARSRLANHFSKLRVYKRANLFGFITISHLNDDIKFEFWNKGYGILIGIRQRIMNFWEKTI